MRATTRALSQKLEHLNRLPSCIDAGGHSGALLQQQEDPMRINAASDAEDLSAGLRFSRRNGDLGRWPCCYCQARQFARIQTSLSWPNSAG
jgi:hypothetical protein